LNVFFRLGRRQIELAPATRERGDGSDAVDHNNDHGKSSAAKNDQNDSLDGGGLSSGGRRLKPRLIHLPSTNISLEKLPPIKSDDELELPRTSPATPLVKVIAKLINGLSFKMNFLC